MSFLKFFLLFRGVFKAIFKVKVNLGDFVFFLYNYHVLVEFSCLICMDLVAYPIVLTFYDLYLLFMCFL
jgi:hypothetical protein